MDIKRFNELIFVRRELHKIPELSFKEYKTSEFIENYLKNRGVEYKKIIETGIVAFVKGKNKDITFGFRADMDALPIEEEINIEYKSIHKGLMHACGHDFHMSIVLNMIDHFSKNKPPISLLFLFQPGEEGAGGANKMIKEGALEYFSKPDYIFGYHINPEVDTGVICVCSGNAWAGSIEFELLFKGKGGHGAYPHKGNDLIFAFSKLYVNMQGLIARVFNPQNSLVLSCGKITGALKSNVFPNKLVTGCTFRYFDTGTRKKFLELINSEIMCLKKIMKCDIKLKIISDYIPLFNDPEMVNKIKLWYKNYYKINGENIAKNSLNTLPELKDCKNVTISDDMSYFLKSVRGVYFFLGVNNGNTDGLHTSRLNPDEKALYYGYNFFEKIVYNYKYLIGKYNL